MPYLREQRRKAALSFSRKGNRFQHETDQELNQISGFNYAGALLVFPFERVF
jgi:hypothetical protein